MAAARGRKVGGRRKGKAKATAPAPVTFERELRIRAVKDYLDGGFDENEVMHWLTTEITPADVEVAKANGIELLPKPWKVGKETAREYIRMAWRGWEDEDRRLAPANRKRTLDERRAQRIFRIALKLGEKGDATALRVALSANDQLARMHGSYEPAPPPPEEHSEDMDVAEARKRIQHAAATLALSDRPTRVVSEDEEADAIDMPEPPTVEDAPADSRAPVPAAGGAN